MSDAEDSDTVEDLPALPPQDRPAGPGLVIDLAGRTHIGKVRPTNQDHFHIVRFGRYLRTVASSLPVGEAPEDGGDPGYAFTVADGIGGRAGGEAAARLAIRLLIDCVLQTPDWVLGRGEHLLARVMDRFADRFRVVNAAVLAQAALQPDMKGMGTTLSVALSWGGDLLVSHVGDSRAYLYRAGRLHRLTQDHVTEVPLAGPPGTDAVRFRRVLSRGIGLSPAAGDPDLYHYALEDGDRLLLCTDGLTDMVDEFAIAAEVGRAADAAGACDALIDRALAAGGRDNVTVVVATYRLPAG